MAHYTQEIACRSVFERNSAELHPRKVHLSSAKYHELVSGNEKIMIVGQLLVRDL